jgi:hypothetical protein
MIHHTYLAELAKEEYIRELEEELTGYKKEKVDEED